MSNFAESHSLPTFKERRKATGKKMAKWYRADKVVDLVYVDIINGLSKSDVIQKLTEGLYPPQEDRGVKYDTALDYWNAAQQRLMYDFEDNAESIRADLMAKLTAVYADAVEHSDRYNAIQALNTIMKLTGVSKDVKNQNNIQVNASKEGITINFGFNKEENNTDDTEL